MKTDVENLLEGHGVSPTFKYQSFPRETEGEAPQQNEQEGGPQLLTEIFAQLEKTPPRKKFGEQLLTDIFDQLGRKIPE